VRDPLTAEELVTLTADHPDWLVEDNAMGRTFTFTDFSAAMAFVTRVALAAEQIDHHPDIDVRWNKVTLLVSTHSAGALTELDRSLVGTIDGFDTGSNS
jgi:4a-hydroxytetrahydrobiopterin dehydratase